MRICKLLILIAVFFIIGKNVRAHYWCNVITDISFSDGAECPETRVRIFYLADSLYWVTPQCGQADTSFLGHCDASNTVTYFSKGYYQKSLTLSETCERVSLGVQPPPAPIARATCTVTLDPGPVANAGSNHPATLFENDTLDGTGSIPLDGHPIVSYHWASEPSNPGLVVFIDSTVARPTFIPIATGDYTFYLTVEDDAGLSAVDTVMVKVCDAGQECVVPVKPLTFPVAPWKINLVETAGTFNFTTETALNNMVIYNAQGRVLAMLRTKDGKSFTLDSEQTSTFPAGAPLVAIGVTPEGRKVRSDLFAVFR